MFSRIRAFLSRHRRKFAVAGIVIGGAILLARYQSKALREFQEKLTKDLLERAIKQQNYDNVQHHCNEAALHMIPILREEISSLYDTETLVKKLREGNCNKILVWEELKYLAFAKVTLLIYSCAILVITLRIQLSLIGGYLFKSKTTNEMQELENFGIQNKYMELVRHFLHDGIPRIGKLIQEKVEIVLRDRSLKEKLTIQDIEQIFWSINNAVRNDAHGPCVDLASYVVTESADVPQDQMELYNKIVTETKELLESEEIQTLTCSSISRGFTFFIDKVAEYFIVRNGSSSSPDPFYSANMVEDKGPSMISKPMANVIPIVNGLLNARESSADMPHTWMQQLILMEDLKLLGANIFESFSV